MTNLNVNALFYVLTVVSVTAAGLLAVITAYRALRALRAKHRAHVMLLHAAIDDEQLQRLLTAAQHETITDKQIKEAIDKIATIILKLPSEDQKFLESAIHQRNPVGTRRFVKSMLLAA